MASISFKIDENINFYFYLMNLYAYDLSEVDLDFRKKHSDLRSQEFFKSFEQLENPFVKQYLNLSSISEEKLSLINIEKDKFKSVWPEYYSLAKDLKELLEPAKKNILSILEKCLKIINLPIKHTSLVVQIVPFLKPHGKQDTSNFIYLSKKDEFSLDDYIFVIVHEFLHLVLYDFMSKYYFKYNYSDKLHKIEEVMINFVYFEAVKEDAEPMVVPRWLYLNDGETFEVFFKLSHLQDKIKKEGLVSFINSAIELLNVTADEK